MYLNCHKTKKTTEGTTKLLTLQQTLFKRCLPTKQYLNLKNYYAKTKRPFLFGAIRQA